MPGYFDDSYDGMGGNAARDYMAYASGQGGLPGRSPDGSTIGPGSVQSAALPPVGAAPISQNYHSGRNGVNGAHMGALGRVFNSLFGSGASSRNGTSMPSQTPSQRRIPKNIFEHLGDFISGQSSSPPGWIMNAMPGSGPGPGPGPMGAGPGGHSLGGGYFGGTASPTDSGGWGAPPTAPPSYQPATKITSGDVIGQRISAMLNPVPADTAPPTFGDDSINGMIGMPPDMAPPDYRPQMPGADDYAHGGPIHMMRGGYPELYDAPVRQGYFATGGGSNYVEPDGRGDGRSDHVEARLSPGEYVIDAETVGLLGNGDNDAGARNLDGMRKKVRMQKGKELAKGKFSPNAKDAAEYLVSDPISDGMRRRGKDKG